MSRVSLLYLIISIVWIIFLPIGITREEKASIKHIYRNGCFSKNLNDAFSQEHPSIKVTVLGPPVKNQSIIEQCSTTCKGFFEGYDYILAIQNQVCVCLTLFFGEVQLYSIPDDCCDLKTADNNSSSTIGGINAFSVFCEAKECRSHFENTTFSKEATSCTEFTEMNQNFDNPRINVTTKLLQVPHFPSKKLISCNSENCTFRFNKNGQLCQNFEIETEDNISNESPPVTQFLAEYIPKVEDNPKLCMEHCTFGIKTFQYIESHFKYAMVSTVFIENIGFFGLCQCSNDLAKFEERNIKICEKCQDYDFENETTIYDSSHSNITNTVYTYCNLSDTTECLEEIHQEFHETFSETESMQKFEFTWFQISYALLMLPILLVHNWFVFLCIAIVLILVSLVLFSLFLLVKLLCSCNDYESILGLDDLMENTLTYSPAVLNDDKVFHTYGKNREDKV